MSPANQSFQPTPVGALRVVLSRESGVAELFRWLPGHAPPVPSPSRHHDRSVVLDFFGIPDHCRLHPTSRVLAQVVGSAGCWPGLRRRGLGVPDSGACTCRFHSEVRRVIQTMRRQPNTSVEPTAYAVSLRMEMDSSFTFAVSSAPAHAAVAQLYSLGGALVRLTPSVSL